MSKNKQTKLPINLSIDKEILKDFKVETKKRAINRSGLIQNFIKEWLKENK